MKKITIKLLVGRSGASESNSPGDKIEVSPDEAWALITSVPPQAETTSKKSYDALEKFILSEQNVAAEKAAKLAAIQHRDTLVASAKDHIDSVGEIMTTLATVDPEAVDEIVQHFHDTITPITSKDAGGDGAVDGKSDDEGGES